MRPHDKRRIANLRTKRRKRNRKEAQRALRVVNRQMTGKMLDVLITQDL